MSRFKLYDLPQEDDILLNIVDSLDAMVAYWDQDQCCVFANKAYLDWFGKSRKELTGSTLRSLLGEKLYGLNLPYINAAYAGEIQVFERAITLPNGTVRPSLATYRPDIKNGIVHGIFVHVADVSPMKKLEADLRKAKEQAEHLSMHDFLTGLPNRLFLQKRMSSACNEAIEKHHTMAAFSIDLDDFKLVNDTYGHSVGDSFLQKIVQRIKPLIPDSGALIRMGGDEFFLLLPSVKQASSVTKLAEDILNELQMIVTIDGYDIQPSASIGIALFQPHEIHPQKWGHTLFECSDRALYEAKKLGKNRYQVFSGIQELKRNQS